MALIALDSTIIVILAGGRSAEHRAKERAEDLIANHRAAGDNIAIPAAVIAECFHQDERLVDRMMILDLNAAAAILANKLMLPMKAAAAKRAERQCVRADSLILATAEIRGAVAIYTTDDWFKPVAEEHKLKIKVRPLPDAVFKQRPLTGPDGTPILRGRRP